MSRFVQLLRDWKQPLDYVGAVDLCGALRERMNAERGRVQVRFPVFVERLAPVTGESGMLRLDVTPPSVSRRVRYCSLTPLTRRPGATWAPAATGSGPPGHT